jgi:4-alpha-glucanotransferase
VKFLRCSGILLHCTSLPSRFGVGDFGPSAYEFADFLSAAGQKLWQVLPLNPTGYGDSPYQCFSAFAGNPLLLSLELLRDRGLLRDSDLSQAPSFPADWVDFQAMIEFKRPLLKQAAETFFADASAADRSAYDRFCVSASLWLDDFALFMALKDAHHGAAWSTWSVSGRCGLRPSSRPSSSGSSSFRASGKP